MFKRYQAKTFGWDRFGFGHFRLSSLRDEDTPRPSPCPNYAHRSNCIHWPTRHPGRYFLFIPLPSPLGRVVAARQSPPRQPFPVRPPSPPLRRLLRPTQPILVRAPRSHCRPFSLLDLSSSPKSPAASFSLPDSPSSSESLPPLRPPLAALQLGGHPTFFFGLL